LKIYLDSSALVKLVHVEPETDALRRYLRRHRTDRFVTSALSRVEVVRAVLGGGSEAIQHARRQLSRLDQIALDASMLDQAATLSPDTRLRSLDAVHLAAAGIVGAELRSLVTYDLRLAEAALRLGLMVEVPA
jgi:predicted nucleic acid-binding protein